MRRTAGREFSKAIGACYVSTGDLARVLPSGEVEVLGREGDSWARVLGYPVDLRRIERLLESLAALGRERLESERAARSGPVAPELRRIWEEILGCPAGDEESFFDLGGTSCGSPACWTGSTSSTEEAPARR
jgi:acyl-CoA synthetase (AMP-forming)/AMP-acid ligase II